MNGAIRTLLLITNDDDSINDYKDGSENDSKSDFENDSKNDFENDSKNDSALLTLCSDDFHLLFHSYANYIYDNKRNKLFIAENTRSGPSKIYEWNFIY